MVAEGRSLQDRIRDRRRSGFVGRQGQVIQYQENLRYPVEDERRRFLFNIHGDAGVGKTYLTRQLQRIATESGALTAYIDETVEDVTAAMTVMAEQFALQGARLSEFEKRAADYRQRRHELESDQHAPDGVAAFITKTAVTIGFAAARDVPVAGSLLAPVDAAAAADAVNQARVYLAQKFKDHTDVRLLLSPADELTPVFVAGVNRIAASGRTVALFIDTYERTAPLLDSWLHGLYDGRYGDLTDTLITTVSGQTPLNPNLWSDCLPIISDVSLEPFSEAEARQFLASKGISDEATIEVILTLSGCLPLWLATLAEARRQDNTDIGDPAGDAVGRFLKWESDPERRDIAVAAALPRVLNQETLAVIAPAVKAPELFDWLRGLPFVSERAGSWAYHEVVRSAMIRLRRAETPAQWRSQHHLLARANSKWASQTARDDKSGTWTNPVWVDYAREEMYHLLCADPQAELPRALASAVKATEQDAARARQWATLIIEAGQDSNNNQLRELGSALRRGICETDLTQYFGELIDSGELDEATLSVAFVERGNGYRLSGQLDKAITDLARGIELSPRNARAMTLRGIVYYELRRFADAIADLDRVIELEFNIYANVVLRGLCYWREERFEEALPDLTRALDLDPTRVEVISLRGVAYAMIGRHDEAIADLTSAIELTPGQTHLIPVRGWAYLLAGRHEEAIADLTQAIELDPSQSWHFRTRGQAYVQIGLDDEAVADLNKAVELDPANSQAIVNRLLIFYRAGQYDETLLDLNRCIELDSISDQAAIIAFRGQTYKDMSRNEEAITDLARAIELDPSRPWVLTLRGEICKNMDRNDEAIADFTRAIELNPEQASVIVLRGESLETVGRNEEAIADFTRAIELEPNNIRAIARRGIIQRDEGNYEEAIKDFNRAMELGLDHASIALLRGMTYWRAERYEEALPDLTRRIELNPTEEKFINIRSMAYYKSRHYDEAIADATRSIELNPDQALVIALRGMLYKETGRYQEAIVDFTRAAELDPDNDDFPAELTKVHQLIEKREDALREHVGLQSQSES
jgi:tetratricopeptide (TPR) repeat protein